ncbi:MAG: imidazoleglycerol-phosphate dehydratase HisB [Firmicutes bacterium]|nr:imidazoleglycerol-phosphate dehydratase HisB [Bacillota bacterium]
MANIYDKKVRGYQIIRKTAETDINLEITLDGSGKSTIDTGCGFLDHMLTLFARHGRFDLDVTCKGDTYVDYHHTAEDIGIVLGQAFAQAIGDKKGITRYGSFILPMDEALIMSAVDISGRSYLGYSIEIPTEKVGDFDTELVEEFWLGFVRNAQVTLHIRQLAGTNSHHIIEGAFKSAARSLKAAVTIDPDFADEIPSTKGVL